MSNYILRKLVGHPDIPPPVPEGSGVRFQFSDYTYFYDRFGSNDWIVHVYFSDGVVDSIGYRPTDPDDFKTARELQRLLQKNTGDAPNQ
jgi:hypothetical protein